MDREHLALHHGGQDAAEAQERLKMGKFINEQLHDAAEHRAAGRLSLAHACEERAAQYTRDLRKREKTLYSYEEREQSEALEYGESELDKMIKFSAEQLEEKKDEIQAMVEGHRDMSSSESSYVLTGSGEDLRLSKVKHPGIPAKHISARIGTTDDEKLLNQFKGHGVETREDPEPEQQKTEPPPEPKMSHPLDVEVAAGILGGA